MTARRLRPARPVASAPLRRLGLLALLLAAPMAGAAEPDAGPIPWDLPALLATVPAMEPTDLHAQPPLRSLFYEGMPLAGAPTRVYAYYGTPDGATPAGGWPAMVLLHGGGGTAFPEWVARWNRCGYAALAMDLEGHLPTGEPGKRPRHHAPGPERTGTFRDAGQEPAAQWGWHALSAIILGHSLLRSFPEVDAARTGITGISWGGVLTTSVIGLDPRFRFAIPVYGCGFLDQADTGFGTDLRALPGAERERVMAWWDGGRRLARTTTPTLWLNGRDRFFPLDVFARSAAATGGRHLLRLRLDMAHGHEAGWEPAEIVAFADSVVRGGDPLPALGPPEARAGEVRLPVRSVRPLAAASLQVTRQRGIWLERTWETLPATIDAASGTVAADVPADATAWFVNVRDERGFETSSDPVIAP